MSSLGFEQTIKGVYDETHISVEADLPHATYAGLSDLAATRITSYLAEQIKNAIQPDIVLLVVRFDKWETYPAPRVSEKKPWSFLNRLAEGVRKDLGVRRQRTAHRWIDSFGVERQELKPPAISTEEQEENHN
jgi:hypothetical protein